MVDECFIVPLMFASQFTHVWLIQFNSIKFMYIQKKKKKKTMRKNKKISKTIKYQLTITISRKTKTQSNPDIF